MSISSDYLSLTRSTNGLSGMVSGLDTDSLVEALLLGQQSKIDKMNQKYTMYEYKQEAYRDVISEIDTFSNKYLSYTSSTSLISNTFFSQMATSSSSSNFNVTAGSSAIDGDMQMKIDQLATTSTLTGGQISSVENIDLSINTSSLLAASESKASFTLTNDDGSTKTITLSETEIADAISAKGLEKDEMTFSIKDGKLEITLEEGWSAKVDATGSDCTSLGLSKLGLTAGTSSSSFDKLNDDDELESVNGFNSTYNANASATLEVNLDGVTKSIKLEDFLVEDSGTVDITKTMENLKDQLEGVFGSNSIIFSGNETDGYSISTYQGRQITLGGTSEILDGLGISSGTTNTLSSSNKVGTVFAAAFAQDSYTQDDEDGNKILNSAGTAMQYTDLLINGEKITISEDMSISQMVSAVNNSDANVKMTFDSYTNTFSIASSDSGDGFDIELDDENRLLKSLMGVSDDNLDDTFDDIFKNSVAADTDAGTLGGISYSSGQNAIFTLNGIKTERSSNNFTINGLTFELKEAHEADEKGDTISTSLDVDSIMEGITSFIDDYNALIESLNGKVDEKYDSEYPPLTDAQKAEMSESEIANWDEKAKTGVLENDDLVNDFLSAMRSTMYAQYGDDNTALWQIGIEASSEWTENGKLHIDEDKLKELLLTDPEVVQNIFTGADGLISNVSSVVKTYANTSSASPGLLVQKAGVEGTGTESNNTLYNYMQDCLSKLEKLELNYSLQSDRYWSQFNYMEVVLSQLSSQSAWLSQQMSY